MTRRLLELAALFLKLGTISFGGPAAHIAIMEDETVRRRGWISREHFLDMVGVTNLIPGPNAQEMAEHLGFCRAGLWGSVVAGLCFALPGLLITVGLAWGYVEYHALPQVQPLLYGIKPAILAVLVSAVWRLGRSAVRTWPLALICGGVVAAVFLGADEVATLLLGSLIGVALLYGCRRGANPRGKTPLGLWAAVAAGGTSAAAPAATAAAAAPMPLWQLALFFLKVGAVLYGSGFVLIAYLEGGLVGHGLTERQLLDAIAIGQLTPGPILTTAAFVGYLMAGPWGAAVAAAAIFAPSFAFVAAVNPLIPRLRRWSWTALFLDSVNAASVGLMGAVAVTLAGASLVDRPSCLIALAALVAALKWKVAPAWLVLGGAVLGLLVRL